MGTSSLMYLGVDFSHIAQGDSIEKNYLPPQVKFLF